MVIFPLFSVFLSPHFTPLAKLIHTPYNPTITQWEAGLKNWLVYIVACADGTLYCGITNNLTKRLENHNKGTASKYTRSRRPVALVAVRESLDKSQALKLERKIKKSPTPKKIDRLKDENFI